MTTQKLADNGGSAQPSSSALVLDAPYCGYCGASGVRPSTRGGTWERLLRLFGATLYRCEGCGRRFGFVALGHPHRHHRGEASQPRQRHSKHGSGHRVRSEDRRRRLVRVAWTVGAALLSFLLAAYMISRTERRSIEGEGVVAPIVVQ